MDIVYLWREKKSDRFMEMTSFRSPFEKVYRRSKQTFAKKGFTIHEDKGKPGLMIANRKATLFHAAIELEIVISKIDEHSTNIAITCSAKKHWFDRAYKENRLIEGRYIAMITTRI